MPSIDLSFLNRLYRDDQVRVAQWVDLFLEEFPARMAEIDQCLAGRDPERLAALAHELKPQAHYLGAEDLMQAIVVLAGCSATGDAEARAAAIRDLHRAGEAVMVELRTLFSA